MAESKTSKPSRSTPPKATPRKAVTVDRKEGPKRRNKKTPRRAAKGTASDSERPPRRPYWSGTIAFGLVTLPVDLYSATKPAGVSLRMIDDDGTRLQRRYYCPRHEVVLDSDDIVRGYPVGDDAFVVVEDDELDALDPERSQEIDLTRFVPEHDIDPSYVDNAYVLAPGQGAVRAYRLLARSLEEADRAGVATMVMRGRQYVVALTAQGGILRLSTLRFHDELRTPEQIGLPGLASAHVNTIKAMETAIAHLEKDEISTAELEDPSSGRLLKLVARKLKRDEDVFQAATAASEDEDDDDAIEIMTLLKRSLAEA